MSLAATAAATLCGALLAATPATAQDVPRPAAEPQQIEPQQAETLAAAECGTESERHRFHIRCHSTGVAVRAVALCRLGQRTWEAQGDWARSDRWRPIHSVANCGRGVVQRGWFHIGA